MIGPTLGRQSNPFDFETSNPAFAMPGDLETMMSLETFTSVSEVWIFGATAILVVALFLPHLNMQWRTKAKAILGSIWLLGALTACYGVFVVRAASFLYHRSGQFGDGMVFWFMSGVFFITPLLWYRRANRYYRNHSSS